MTDSDAAGAETGGLFAAIDAKDTQAFLGFLAEDAVFRFGSAPAVHGRKAIAAAVGGFFGTIAACSHEISHTISDGSTLVCEGNVTYTRADGSCITLPFADILEYEGELIRDYKIYMDISPLYAE
jgi:ketosteroid isomerase-like protein